jgi:hypothetical protein
MGTSAIDPFLPLEEPPLSARCAAAAIGAMQAIGNKLNATFNNASNSLG